MLDRGRERSSAISHLLLHGPAEGHSVLGKAEARIFMPISHPSARGPNARATFCCFSDSTSRQLGWESLGAQTDAHIGCPSLAIHSSHTPERQNRDTPVQDLLIYSRRWRTRGAVYLLWVAFLHTPPLEHPGSLVNFNKAVQSWEYGLAALPLHTTVSPDAFHLRMHLRLVQMGNAVLIVWMREKGQSYHLLVQSHTASHWEKQNSNPHLILKMSKRGLSKCTLRGTAATY